MSILLLALAVLGAAVAQNGPSTPINGHTAKDCFGPRDVNFFADLKNLCWFHQCVPLQGLVAKRCALGAYVPNNYEAESYNPCTERFKIQGMYECTRDDSLNAFDVPPPCFDANFQASCKNGGTPSWQGSLCWCDCPPGLDGLPDCSRTYLTTTPSANDTTEVMSTDGPCYDGLPKQDWCRNASATGNPCKNGGSCINECDSFVCRCKLPFTKSQTCDQFTCGADNLPCLNRGVCHRGNTDATPNPSNNNEYATCVCPTGFTGTLCETPTSG